MTSQKADDQNGGPEQSGASQSESKGRTFLFFISIFLTGEKLTGSLENNDVVNLA